MLTIGAFARAARLSPKALRMYAELGLLKPAYVDPVNGFRFYEPEQLERARLVAWLRRLGMPLARIAVVCESTDPAAEVAAYWREVQADFTARSDLAVFLVDHLSRKDEVPMTLRIRYAVRTDTGQVRERNEDAAYAGMRLLAVADGFGANGGGDSASAAVIEALKPLDTDVPAGDLLNALDDAVHQADAALRGLIESDPSLKGAGTTLTALLWSGTRLGLVHIGDSRAYLLRDDDFFQITHDHTVVQGMLDEGTLTPEEAASHPQRAMLLKALQGTGPDPALQLREAHQGDRYLLCSDGLSAVVNPTDIEHVIKTTPDPDQAVQDLTALADQSGAPDNITCVVADVIPA